MKPATRVLFVTLLLTAAGLCLYTWREHGRLAAQQQALQEKIATTRTAIEREQHERERAERELEAAQRAAKESAAATTAALAVATPRSLALNTWEQKVATLRALLTRHPEWTIPEISLLSPDEFIFFARDAQLEGDEAQRKTLNSLRGLAKRKVAQQFRDALHEYALAHDGRLPSDLREISAFLKTSLPDAVLNRYALTGVSAVSPSPSDQWLLYERAPVDEVYDTRHLLGARMSIQTPANPAMYVMARALVAYANANPGRKPVEVAELNPYLEVPLDAATLDQYFSGWQKAPATFGLTRLSTTSATVFRPIGVPVEAPK